MSTGEQAAVKELFVWRLNFFPLVMAVQCVILCLALLISVCRDSSVVITTIYGLDGAGIESRWGGEIFSSRPDQPWGPPSLLYNGYRVFNGGKERPGRGVDHPPPHLAPRLKKE